MRLVFVWAIASLFWAGCVEEFDLCTSDPAPSGECITWICENNPESRPDLCGSDGTPVVPVPCDGACAGDTPVCDTSSGVCVQCLDAAQCADGQLCSDNACVDPPPTCTADTDCIDPASPICIEGACTASCANDTQCQRFPSTPVCAPNGACVQCTPDSNTCPFTGDVPNTCDNASVTQYVCDPVTLTCTDELRDCLGECEPCAYDQACIGGSYCVPMTYKGSALGQAFCLKAKVGDSCDATPYFAERGEPESIEGFAATFCGPEQATTCSAINGLNAPCSGDNEAGHAECGFPGVEDAFCLKLVGTQFQCTPFCTNPVTCEGTRACDNVPGEPEDACELTEPPPGT